MFKKPVNHTLDYLLLLVLLSSAALFVKLFAVTKSALLLTTVFVSVGYVVWGVSHHKKAGHIDKKIVLEYAGLAVLVNVLVFSLIL